MLKSELIPTPLVRSDERETIVIDEKIGENIRFRGWFTLQQILGLVARLVWLKLTRKLDPKALGIVLCVFCQNMGVLWIKVGQLMSLRVDLLSPETCDELSKLQYQARGFSPALAKQMVERELGVPINTVFQPFDEMPFAAASICQVHKAYLKLDDVWVAIKVRKPDAEKIFLKDMRTIRRIIRLIDRLGIMPFMGWRDLGWEIEQLLIEELDYRYEAANMRRMRKTLRRHNIYVPKVFRRYSTASVLVMEFLAGELMSDYLKLAHTDPARLKIWRQANNINPDLVGRRLFNSNLRQLFEDNLFHGDLHPGNIMLLRDSRLAFIDFGSIGFSDEDFLKKYRLYLHAITTRQFGKIFDVYTLFAESIPATNLGKLKEQFNDLIQSWQERSRVKGLPYDERALSSANDDLVSLLSTYQVGMPWTFLRFLRVATTLDVTLRELIPQRSVPSLVNGYFQEQKRRMQRQIVQQPSPVLGLSNLLEIPIRLQEDMMYRGIIIRRIARVFAGSLTKASRGFVTLLNIALWAVRIGIFGLGLAFVEQYQIAWLASLLPQILVDLVHWMPRLDIQVWGMLFFGLFYGLYALAKLQRRFSVVELKGSY